MTGGHRSHRGHRVREIALYYCQRCEIIERLEFIVPGTSICLGVKCKKINFCY